MSNSRSVIHELFQKLVSNQMTEQEMETFFQLVKELPGDDVLIAELDAWWQTVDGTTPKDLLKERRMQQQIRELISTPEERPAPRVLRMPVRRIWWAAASFLLVLAAATYLWFQQRPAQPALTENKKPAATDIEPGKDGAILTLEDGSQIILDSLNDGLIANQSGAQVVLANGQLTYDAADQAHRTPSWNTISTPKGRQFKVLLPDGTQVWMNAASSVTYPTFFAGTERNIEVTGEVYLEVAKDPARKFKVKVNDLAVVEVTGTQFNVKAYSDEPGIATTLVEGGVKMYPVTNSTGVPVQLKPGQQGVLVNTGKDASSQKNNGNGQSKIIVLSNINTDKVLAWKNGFFNFEGATLKEAMNQLMRWYNIEVVYAESVPDIQFFGEMSRNISLADLLKALEDVGVHFRIESGRKLIVLP